MSAAAEGLEARRRRFASALFDAGTCGSVASSAPCIEALFALPDGSRFQLVCIPFGPEAEPAEASYFAQLLSWEEPLRVLDADLPRWRQIRGWNARRSPDSPTWSGTPDAIVRGAVETARAWRAQAARAA